MARCPSYNKLFDSDTDIVVGRVANDTSDLWSDYNALHRRWRWLDRIADDKAGPICEDEVPDEPDATEFTDLS
tara:strand:+ start:120 stop:338 length:219 start_codon:yes stop_codon:yes gene_type:complete